MKLKDEAERIDTSMDKAKADDILKRLEIFAELERKATDEAGWIALAFSCGRAKAARMIEQARAT